MAPHVMQNIVLRNPGFWNNIDSYVEQYAHYFTECFSQPQLLNSSTLSPLFPGSGDNDFALLNCSFREINKLYAKKNRIQCKKGIPISVADERKWQEDTYFFLMLISEASIPKIPRDIPLEFKMAVKGMGEMALFVANARAISYTQKKEDVASYYYLKNTIYYKLLRSSSGYYYINPYSKPDVLDVQANKDIESYQRFIDSNPALVDFCNSISTSLSDILKCDQQKLFAIIKLYCYRRFVDATVSQQDIIDSLLNTISLDFPVYVSDLLLSFKRVSRILSQKKRFPAIYSFLKKAILFLIFPVAAGAALIIFDKSGESFLSCFAVGFLIGAFVEAGILGIILALN